MEALNLFIRGLSSFVAVTVLLAVSTSIAVYVYMGSADLRVLYSPRHAYGYGYLVCYNVTGRTISLRGGVRTCHGLSFGSPRYLCVARVPTRVGVSMVLGNSIAHVDVDNGCLLVLEEVPVHIYTNSSSGVVIEVRLYDPWTR